MRGGDEGRTFSDSAIAIGVGGSSDDEVRCRAAHAETETVPNQVRSQSAEPNYRPFQVRQWRLPRLCPFQVRASHLWRRYRMDFSSGIRSIARLGPERHHRRDPDAMPAEAPPSSATSSTAICRHVRRVRGDTRLLTSPRRHRQCPPPGVGRTCPRPTRALPEPRARSIARPRRHLTPSAPGPDDGRRCSTARIRNAGFVLFFVGATGFEPATPCPPDRCANQAAPRPATLLCYFSPRRYVSDPRAPA